MLIMGFKEFLRPKTNKIILTLLSLILSSLILRQGLITLCITVNHYGFPFLWLIHSCITNQVTLCSHHQNSCSFIPDPVALLANIAVWYLVSCLVSFVYIKLKKGKRSYEK